MTEQLNQMAQAWWDWMFPMFWQVSLLIILVTLLDIAIRRWAWPQVRYALWGLIFIKLIIPPAWQMPTSIISWIQPKVENRIFIQVEPANLITTTSQQTSVSSEPQQRQSEPQVSSPVGPKVNWKGLAFLFWLSGVIIFFLLLLLRVSRLPKRHMSQTRGIAPEWFDGLFTEISQCLNLRRKPMVVFSENTKTPAVYGLFRPVLILPDRYFDEFSKEQAGHVLMHELCHLKRGDLMIHWFCIILQVFYWFNPLLIWSRRQMRHVCEICCDLSVANILREKTPDYRNTLLESTYKLFTETVEPGLGLLGLFEEPFRIASRLEWLEKKTWENSKKKIVAAAVTSIIMFICVLPMAGNSQSIEQRDLSPSIKKMKPVDTEAVLSDKDAELIEAAEKGDLSAVSAALANGADVNAKNIKGLTALMKASIEGHADVVKLLLDKGADVNARTDSGYMALTAASWAGHADSVKLLLDNGADVNVKDVEGGTVLMGASWAGHVDVVKLLLDNGADINAKDPEGRTALMAASLNGNKDIVRVLVKAGAKEDNDSKLILATRNGDLAAVSTALNNGANVNAKYTYDKTALMVASEMGHEDIVKLLLDNGADVNAKDTEGITALTSVGPRGHETIVQLLKQAGAIISGDDLAQSNLRNAAVAEEAYWVDYNAYTDSIKKLEGKAYGLYIAEGVTLQIISADNDRYKIIAFHEQGNKKYQISGPGGYVEEYFEPGSVSPTTPTTVLKFSGKVSRGQIFEKEIRQDLVFRLTTAECGWNIKIVNKTQPDHDVVGVVTPPLRGMNDCYIAGWHFRNSDNSGPNDGSVNAPQKEREFNFVLSEADYQAAYIYNELIIHSYEFDNMAEQDKKQIEEQYKKLKPGAGKLAITNLELGNLIVGKLAWIDNMEFEVTLDLPIIEYAR